MFSNEIEDLASSKFINAGTGSQYLFRQKRSFIFYFSGCSSTKTCMVFFIDKTIIIHNRPYMSCLKVMQHGLRNQLNLLVCLASC